MIRRPPRSTRTDTLFPYTPLFRAGEGGGAARLGHARDRRRGGVGEDDDLAGDEPLIAPVARLLERAGAHAARLDDRLDRRGRGRAAALPASHAAEIGRAHV